MLPLMLNVASVPIAVIGNGFSAALRLQTLQSSGADNITTYATDPEARVAELAGERLLHHWPTQSDIKTHRFAIAYVCDIDERETMNIVDWVHATGGFVNVHDRQDLCDFHMPAIVRRGHLQVTVSTDGKVAGLSRILKDYLKDNVFGPEWAERVDDLGARRAAWVAEKLPFAELKQRVESYVAERRWLP